MAGVWLAEIFGVLGEQATRKSARPKSRSLRLLSQDRTSGSISTSYSPAMHLMLYASAAIPKARPSGAGGHVGGEDVVRVAVQILAGPYWRTRLLEPSEYPARIVVGAGDPYACWRSGSLLACPPCPIWVPCLGSRREAGGTLSMGGSCIQRERQRADAGQ